MSPVQLGVLNATDDVFLGWGHDRPTAPPTEPEPEPEPTGVRIASEHPFTSASPLNRSLGADITVRADSDPAVVNLRSSKAQLNGKTFTLAKWVTRTSDPTVTMTVGGTAYSIRRPAGAMLAGDAYLTDGSNPDSWLTTIDGLIATDWYKAAEAGGGNLTANFRYAYRLDGDGMAAAGGLKASDAPFTAGMVTPAEMTSSAVPRDRIRHMLSISLPNSMLMRPAYDPQGTGYRLPFARTVDANSATAYLGTATNGIPMGQVLTLPRGTNPDAWDTIPEVKAFGWALHDYGGVVLDRSSFVTFYISTGLSDTLLGSIKSGIQAFIYPLLTIASNTTVDLPVGPGTPIRTALPEVTAG